jgi:hypothetical protein
LTPPPVTLPRLTTLARTAAPKLLEAVVAPLAIFYAGMVLLGFTGALFAALGWVYLGLAWRLVRRIRVPATMVLAALAITLRTAVAFWTDSWRLYFIQPELGTIVIGFVFLASVRLNRPLVQKLTLDYVHLPAAILRHERMRRFFARITLLWAFVLLSNSAVSIWLAVHEAFPGTFMILRTSVVAVMSGLAIAFSVYAFRRVLRRLHPAHG